VCTFESFAADDRVKSVITRASIERPPEDPPQIRTHHIERRLGAPTPDPSPQPAIACAIAGRGRGADLHRGESAGSTTNGFNKQSCVRELLLGQDELIADGRLTSSDLHDLRQAAGRAAHRFTQNALHRKTHFVCAFNSMI